MHEATRYAWLLGVAGVVFGLGFLGAWFVVGELTPLVTTLAVVSIVGFVAFAALDRAFLAEQASSRAVSHSLGATVILALGIGAAVATYAAATRFEQRWDLTADGRFTLSTQTQSVVRGLDAPITIYGLFRQGTAEAVAFRKLVDGYTALSSELTYEPIDPLTEPTATRQVVRAEGAAEIQRVADEGTVIVTLGSDRRRIEAPFTEQALTDALVSLSTGEERRVCWSDGHGERDPDLTDTVAGYGAVLNRLRDQNYAIEKVRLLTAGIPTTCDLVVVAGPQKDLLPQETEALASWIAGGRPALVLLDATVQGVSTPELAADLGRYGLAVADDVVLENDPNHVGMSPDGEALLVYYGARLSEHRLLDGLPAAVGFAWPRAIVPEPSAEHVTVETLITSSQDAWAESAFDPAAEEAPVRDADEAAGPVPVAVAVEVEQPMGLDASGPTAEGGRLVVFGDADFPDNAHVGLLANGDLFLNAVSWLVGADDEIGERPAAKSELLTVPDAQYLFLVLIAVFVVPGLALAWGAGQAIRRRFS